MKSLLRSLHHRTFVLALCLFAALVPLSGCVPDDDTAKALTEFQHSATVLTDAMRALLLNANVTAESHYIDRQVFAADTLDPVVIQSQALLTPDEIALRVAALQALSDYLSALATLASGAPATQIQASADKCASSLKTLTADSTAAIAHPSSGSTTPNFAAPVSAAVSAIGDVISLIQKHRGQAEVRESIRKNDPQLTGLFTLLSTESTAFYQLQKSALSAVGPILYVTYARARPASPSVVLSAADRVAFLQLSDRIKQFQRDTVSLAASDPAPAIAGFQATHDALIKTVLAPRSLRGQTLPQLVAAARAFGDEVTPLGQNVYTLGRAF